jgi:hypothetical protein
VNALSIVNGDGIELISTEVSVTRDGLLIKGELSEKVLFLLQRRVTMKLIFIIKEITL